MEMGFKTCSLYALARSTMIQFVTYFSSGLCIAWLNLSMWGLSNGPANAVPYFALIGSILLLVLASSLALFLPRIADSVALASVLCVLPWPAMILLHEHSPGGFAFLSLATLFAAMVAAGHLLKTRREKWLVARGWPRLIVRVPLAFLPAASFILIFNARLVLKLLLEGPPR